MSENNQTIKSISLHTCPKCGTEIYVENQITPPIVGNVFTKQQMLEAKEDCKERVKVLSIDEEKKDAVLKWIADPNTVFSGEEVESIINSLLKPEE